ncbi:LysR substrate-binding domain-containing protein [Ralstonia syzygii subsp. celebesensis]|uniref:LysR family transcriptional regulator n=3 Tax=Ralstonia solanacearum species complex TaxID=3116862 RepID=A0AAD0SAY6_RALSL|nr:MULTISPECIES: LysR substrate-binding domain-containing protein [Ralstonia solanacearum species complex]CCA81777.1 putative transcriptional regulator; LysR family [blood disease bacterium R229]AQW31078.1 LysR family transcriptional regulator [blood disease bacterium A2-HR MARDI]AXV84311.1 LysR family transcriptional regulator [Ralstonia solanacearum]AXW55444.1 LysR family transcriptional regulator [Ralstonia solanacearum]QQV55127.1 LysR family transcriptional regulator [Ralstonia syzygii sub
MRFDLTDLRLFLHTAESGSITAGAERAHLTLASASARIRGMEAALGVPLLTRNRRGAETTAAGRTLVHHARVVLQQMERMRGELGEYARGLKGYVRLLSNTAAMTEFLPETLSAFLAMHPEVDIDLEELVSHEIVEAVAQGRADIGIVNDAVDLSGLETFPFRHDRLVLVTARGHPLAERREIAFVETLQEDFVGLTGDNALQAYLAGHAARAGHRLKYRVRLRSFDAVCRMVERNVGVGVIPEHAGIRLQRSMAIRRVRLTDAWATRLLRICVRRFDDLPVYARQLIEHLREA